MRSGQSPVQSPDLEVDLKPDPDFNNLLSALREIQRKPFWVMGVELRFPIPNF